MFVTLQVQRYSEMEATNWWVSLLAIELCTRVNKQGPRRQFPPKVYLVKKLSPGTVSSANSGVAPVPLVNSLPAKSIVKQRSGAWLLVSS